MSTNTESTTLVCLFHHADQASAALRDLHAAGIPQSSISVFGDEDAGSAGSSSLASLGVPSRDLKHLEDGLTAGGTIVAVSAVTEHVDTVERIFGEHKASKIDEAVTDDGYDEAPLAAGLPLAAAGSAVAGETAIPIIEEELQVGKRTVDQGGVRVYRRVVEIPVEEQVTLREEHVVINRTPVDRPATQADLAAQGTRSIELTETAEEAVVGKSAHVVEEVLVSKQVGQRTEIIQDTVRKTEVEIEEIPAVDETTSTRQTF